MSSGKTKVLFIVPYPLHASPSQRFRFEQYFSILNINGIEYRVNSFYTSSNWKLFFKSGQGLKKIFVVGLAFLKRCRILTTTLRYDFVFIHREITPIGPPIIEWIIAKILRKRIIYDFDDAIWRTDRTSESLFRQYIKCRWKVALICRWSYKVSCGNEYLQSFALRYNRQSFVNPTTIDLRHHIVKQTKNKHDIVIGWTGSHSTLKYLTLIEPVIRKIIHLFPKVRFVVIADQPPALSIANFEFIRWSLETEVDDLNQLDIGIMPLPDDDWSKGKCGFKILQYMALKIPAVASPVGVNAKIIESGANGFLCTSEQEWLGALGSLINNPELRELMGAKGYKVVRERYSTDSNSLNFLSFFA